MARPEEKAQAMLNKWVAMREQGNAPRRVGLGKRPFLASQCEHLDDAERFRKQIIREISAGISKIQNPGIGEHQIRDLNDEINKLFREKHHWNRRIKELGGPDFNAMERRQQLEQGDTDDLQTGSGYRYFGAAKDLPGVKELFQKARQKAAKRKRGDIYKDITPDYYGWREEEDGVLLELEAKASERNAKRLKERKEAERRAKLERGEEVSDEEDNEEDDLGVDDDLALQGSAVPTQELIAEAILERKKQALLERLS